MQRPKPTSKLILELCGGDKYLLECAHHGLAEASLARIYNVLDLDEAVTFAASSWRKRQENSEHYERMRLEKSLFSNGLYEIFQATFKSMSWLEKYKSISEANAAKHGRLNPFKGQNLQARLDSVDAETTMALKEALSKPTYLWLFECQYEEEKALQHGDNSNLRVMGFQPYYPNSNNIRQKYAAEISRMISDYPKE